MSEVLVSVVMIAYNQEQFIQQGIEGILMQLAKFPIELIIADDHSTDNTEKIILDLIQNHPNGAWIKYTKHAVNKGMKDNFLWALSQTTGKYIALCEGDDYWTNPQKLQKQVELLEENKDYSMCFHSVTIENSIKKNIYPEIAAENRAYSSDELLLTKVAHTVSFIFRAEYLKLDLSKNKPIFGGDVFLSLMMAEHGKVFGMIEDMGVYRIHPLGISNLYVEQLGVAHQKKFVMQFIFFKKTFPSLSKNAINTKIVDHCITVAKHYYNKKNPQAIIYLLLAIYYRPDLIVKGFKKLVK